MFLQESTTGQFASSRPECLSSGLRVLVRAVLVGLNSVPLVLSHSLSEKKAQGLPALRGRHAQSAKHQALEMTGGHPKAPVQHPLRGLSKGWGTAAAGGPLHTPAHSGRS